MDYVLSKMDNFKKTIRYNTLFSLYGPLLSDTQQEILSDYFLYDLSLSEIASNRKISRSAVEDALKKGSKKLDFFETELELMSKQIKIEDLLFEIKKDATTKQTLLIEEIERIIH